MKRQQNASEDNQQDQYGQFPQPLPLMMHLKNVPADVMAILKERAEAWHMKFPRGEPMYKRIAPFRTYIEPGDLVKMYGVSLRTAQRTLQNIRILLEMKKNEHVSVHAYCFEAGLDEEKVRDFLNKEDEKKWKAWKESNEAIEKENSSTTKAK